jgi:hypothetical protein
MRSVEEDLCQGAYAEGSRQCSIHQSVLALGVLRMSCSDRKLYILLVVSGMIVFKGLTLVVARKRTFRHEKKGNPRSLAASTPSPTHLVPRPLQRCSRRSLVYTGGAGFPRSWTSERDNDLGPGHGASVGCHITATPNGGALHDVMVEYTWMAAARPSLSGWQAQHRLRGHFGVHGLRGDEATRARSFGRRHVMLVMHGRQDLSVAASRANLQGCVTANENQANFGHDSRW